MAEAPEPRTVTLPLRAWVGLGLLATLMLVIFLVQLAAIDHQRRIADRQEERTVALIDAGREQVRQIRPIVAGARELAPRARRFAVDAEALVRTGVPLFEELAAADVQRALVVTTELVTEAIRRDLVDNVARVPELVALQRELVALQRELIGLQRELLALQRSSHGILRESLGVQRESLRHVRSLDRKTGGPVLGTGAGAR